MKTCSTISKAKAMAISAASTPCCVPICSRRPSRKSVPDEPSSCPKLSQAGPPNLSTCAASDRSPRLCRVRFQAWMPHVHDLQRLTERGLADHGAPARQGRAAAAGGGDLDHQRRCDRLAAAGVANLLVV